MEHGACRGCVRARVEDAYALPGSAACLGCARAVPGNPDRWLARPPGGSPITCDDRGVCLTTPLPAALLHGMAAAAALSWMLLAAGADVSVLALAVLATLATAAARRWGRQIRHHWGIWRGRVRHTIQVGGLAVTRTYPAAAIRAFHCAGHHGNGPVGFHHGRYTVRVTGLPAPADNEWLMRRLNERLAEARDPRVTAG